MRETTFGLVRKSLAVLCSVGLALGSIPALAQGPAVPDCPTCTLAGNVIVTPLVPPGFLFEAENAPGSLKDVPIWNEFEQLLDNPYAMAPDPGTPGNDQGFSSFRTTIQRRRSFLPAGCDYDPATAPPACNDALLDQFLIHPLNYNYTTGQQMRLLNPNYPGGNWPVFDAFVYRAGSGTPGTYDATYVMQAISPGADRIEPGDTVPDFNSPTVPADTPICIVTTESSPAEGATLCGGDTGEPPGYSVPAVVDVTPGPVVTLRLVDAAGCLERNFESPGSCTNGGRIVRLRKPTVRRIPNGQPNFLVNSAEELLERAADEGAPAASAPAFLLPSNENDYVAGNTFAQRQTGRLEAMRLGKSLFWDMQVGSDTVQSCGSCHFHAGADNRIKNQMNPKGQHGIGATDAFEVVQPTEELTIADFPFHKLTNPEIAGDPLCTPAITATVPAGVLENNLPGGGSVTVCDAANIVSTTNDVASSMGVKFGMFNDIPPIGAGVGQSFGPASLIGGVRSLLPDSRSPTAADNVDPFAVFAGTLLATDPNFGHQFRRVEPRNTPTFINQDFNFDNFWDGRARHDSNGGSVFGPADPQSHVMANDGTAGGPITATRQIIRFASVASLATGPALSKFEMSFQGRNWAKLGKKLLQGTVLPSATSVTPLANQLVSPSDSILGADSNQGGSRCIGLGRPTALGKPGLCTTYREMIQRAFNSRLWANTTQHFNGCFTDGNALLHPNQCAAGTVSIPVLEHPSGLVVDSAADPFDGYVLSTPVAGAAAAADTNQFTQMEANMSLFMGLSVHLWATILISDDSPFDRFNEANPDAFLSNGEAGEVGIGLFLPNCITPGVRNPTGPANGACFTPVGNFKRDPAFGGTRAPNAVDPLLGMDIFIGSNNSGKNPNFRAARCGECHAAENLTDHTLVTSNQLIFGDHVPEFVTPGTELFPEPLGRGRVISGFMLEDEINGSAQDAIERNIINQNLVPTFDPIPVGELGITMRGLAVPSGSAYFDNGVYNIGVTPCAGTQSSALAPCDDMSRGDNDPFGWPMSLSALMLKNLGGPDFEPGVSLLEFDPALGKGGGLLEETAQDQFINPGYEEEAGDPEIPPYLYPFTSNVPVGDAHPELDEVFGAINTLTQTPMLEGYLDLLGPFNPAGTISETFNNANGPSMGMWPVPNRVARFGSIKAPQLRHVELTAPYFHNGGKLTLRQQIDFYTHGGDFPITNAEHRDFNIVNLNIEVQSNISEEEKVALVDFLLELTDNRVRFDQAPFDHPEVFVPLDGTAPENTFSRDGFLAQSQGVLGAAALCVEPSTLVPLTGATGPCFRQVKAVGAAGRGPAVPGDPNTGPLPNFLGISSGPRLVGGAANCAVVNNHYCH